MSPAKSKRHLPTTQEMVGQASKLKGGMLPDRVSRSSATVEDTFLIAFNLNKAIAKANDDNKAKGKESQTSAAGQKVRKIKAIHETYKKALSNGSCFFVVFLVSVPPRTCAEPNLLRAFWDTIPQVCFCLRATSLANIRAWAHAGDYTDNVFFQKVLTDLAEQTYPSHEVATVEKMIKQRKLEGTTQANEIMQTLFPRNSTNEKSSLPDCWTAIAITTNTERLCAILEALQGSKRLEVVPPQDKHHYLVKTCMVWDFAIHLPSSLTTGHTYVRDICHYFRKLQPRREIKIWGTRGRIGGSSVEIYMQGQLEGCDLQIYSKPAWEIARELTKPVQ